MSAPVIHFEEASGFLEVILSPMYSGKTTLLLNKLNTFAVTSVGCLYVNSTLDTRGSVFSTHNPLITSLGSISSLKLSKLSPLLHMAEEYDVIGIDEAGFFPDLKEVVLELVEKRHKRVIVAGLSGDYLRRPLGHLLELIPYADSVAKLSSVCKWCAEKRQMREASFSHRIVESDSTILIGMKESYVPLCRKCYLSTSQEACGQSP
jgi:thymidine kinase